MKKLCSRLYSTEIEFR